MKVRGLLLLLAVVGGAVLAWHGLRGESRARSRRVPAAAEPKRGAARVVGEPQAEVQKPAPPRAVWGVRVLLPDRRSAAVGARITLASGREMVTNKQGRVILDVTYPVEVKVSLEGYAEVEQWIAPGGEEEVITLGLGGVLRGVVIDRAGRPVAGMLVVCRCEGTHSATTHSGKDGRFILRGLYYGLDLEVEALDGSRRGKSPALEIPHGEAAEIVVRVRHQPSVVLRVLDPEGRPVRGAEVVIAGEDQDLRETDEPGHYRSLALQAGEFEYVVSAAGWAMLHGKGVLQGTGRSTIEVRLRDRHTLSGTVVDPDGVPVGGLKVKWQGGDAQGWTLTRPDGRYSIRGVQDAAGRIKIEPEDFAATVIEAVRPGARVDIRLQRAEVFGVVRPVPRERALLVQFDTEHLWIEQQTTLDDRGRFSLFNLPVGVRTRLRLCVAGHAAFMGYELELAPNERFDLETLELHGKTLAGVVNDPAGKPIAAARVLLYWEEGHFDRTGRVLFTDVKGRFEALYLPDTAIKARVTARGFQPAKRWLSPKRGLELALTLRPKPR